MRSTLPMAFWRKWANNKSTTSPDSFQPGPRCSGFFLGRGNRPMLGSDQSSQAHGSQQMKPWLWLLLSFVVAGTTWAYTHRVLVPWEYQVNVVSGNIKAPMGDLYSPWVGTQALLIHRLNPYGPEVSREIQIGFYGHPVVQDLQQPSRTPVDEQRFAYPVFVAFLLAPAIHAPFPEVQRWAEVVLAILVAASTLLWLDFASWGPSKIATLAIIVLVISSPQIVQGLRFRQLALVVGFLLAAATWCVRKNHLATAGVLLAISTIKPQMILPVLVWFLLWAASEWRARWRLIAGFTGMFLLLIGAGELLLPGWIWILSPRAGRVSKISSSHVIVGTGSWAISWVRMRSPHHRFSLRIGLEESERGCGFGRIRHITKRIFSCDHARHALAPSLQSSDVDVAGIDPASRLAGIAGMVPPSLHRVGCVAMYSVAGPAAFFPSYPRAQPPRIAAVFCRSVRPVYFAGPVDRAAKESGNPSCSTPLTPVSWALDYS